FRQVSATNIFEVRRSGGLRFETLRLGLSVPAPFGYAVPHSPPPPLTYCALCRLLRCVQQRLAVRSVPTTGQQRRFPEVSLTAFTTHPPGLPTHLLMAMDFAIIGSLVQAGRPHIWFLFVRSWLCSALPSDPASRRRPCA